MSFIPRVGDLTFSDVRKILDECLWENPPNVPFPGRKRSTFSTKKWQEDLCYSVQKREKHIINLCQHLRECVRKTDSHISEIDSALSSVFQCRIVLEDCRTLHGDPELSEDAIAFRAYDILRRLPSCPLDLIDLPSNLDGKYVLIQDSLSHIAGPSWETLKVSNYLSVIIVQLALSRVGFVSQYTDACPNELAEILAMVSHLAAEETSEFETKEWFIVRAAIWSSWQRAVMLCFYFNLSENLEAGFAPTYTSQHNLRETTPSPNLSVRKMSELYATKGKVDSMCSWAFNLLRKDPVCLGMDFRTFHHRYQQLWGMSRSRCKPESGTSCLGKDPDECRRFNGLIVCDQSVHDSSCSSATCRKLLWDEASYRAEKGARAVCLDEGLEKSCSMLRYCRASQQTLAISHVWSHGQGGRPHDGINLCLHRRYVQIRRDLGCSEYWWDAACIPDHHELRSEAISNINSIFEKSKVTLVCDQDLMKIDISSISVKLLESILATALVCDWNLRAWTFLESFRGRHQIHLLCKDNRTINFRDLCIDIYKYGGIDMAIFILNLAHMLPRGVKNPYAVSFASATVPRLDNSVGAEDYSTYLDREIAGSHLSYRPASRKGDDIVIWSLLTGNVKFDLAEDLWLSNIWEPLDSPIHTGFLISSAPRSNKKGLSWLPATFYFKSSSQLSEEAHDPLRALSGQDSTIGIFTDKGISADWLVYEFDTSDLTASVGPARNAKAELMNIVQRYLQNTRWGALLQPTLGYRTFALKADVSAKYKDHIEGTVLAVVGSCSAARPSQIQAEDGGWTWKGIYVWSKDVQLPSFQEIGDFFIE